MDFLLYFDLSLAEIYFIVFVVFIASIIRGFNGFGFSATCISGFSFILPAVEIVPIILALEVIISIFMVPYVWNKIDWNFVFKLLIGITIGSPIGLYLLKYLSSDVTHISVCVLVIFFSFLLMKGYENKKIDNSYAKMFTGIISGTSLLVLSYRENEKFKAQGFNDLIVYSIQATASLSAGVFLTLTSWKTMNLVCIIFLVLIILSTLRADIKERK